MRQKKMGGFGKDMHKKGSKYARRKIKVPKAVQDKLGHVSPKRLTGTKGASHDGSILSLLSPEERSAKKEARQQQIIQPVGFLQSIFSDRMRYISQLRPYWRLIPAKCSALS